MSSRCKFPKCDWLGQGDLLLDHCQSQHSNFVRKIGTGNKIVFTFEEVFQSKTFVLSGNNGLYWFKEAVNDETDGFAKGVFAVGGAEVINYSLKVGNLPSGRVYYLGPFKVQPENSNYYQLFFAFDFIEYINKRLNRKMTLYLGDCEDSDDAFVDESIGGPSSNAATGSINSRYLEQFTCNICLEFIRENARFCENRHFLCNSCYGELMRRQIFPCPVCRGRFLSDTQSEDVEELLRNLRFPE